jgi:hypothetical protein
MVGKMAKIIPELDLMTIENQAERDFYKACQSLSDDYTVLYSMKFRHNNEDNTKRLLKEADFVILHKNKGFIVIEVKFGEITYQDGKWFWSKQNSQLKELRKNPIWQASSAKHDILNLYKEKYDNNYVPVIADYAISFPTSRQIKGDLPPEINRSQILLYDDLFNLEEKIKAMFKTKRPYSSKKTMDRIIDFLSPIFNIYSQLEDKIQIFNDTAEKILTEQQQHILSGILEKRVLFLGGAGTGKTYVAIEKARQLAKAGKKVLLTCYTKKLPKMLMHVDDSNIVCVHFHDFLYKWLINQNYQDHLNAFYKACKNNKELEEYFNTFLPETFVDVLVNLDNPPLFDAIIVDEGQDFKQDWIQTLELLIKDEGEFFIFADHRQNIFKRDMDFNNFKMYKQGLTLNFRNTRQIHEKINQLINDKHYTHHNRLTINEPVQLYKWKNNNDQMKLIKREVNRLISQGISPNKIVILSPNQKKYSSLRNVDRIGPYPIEKITEDRPQKGIRFDTIRSFKGLESDIVFLIDIREDDRLCNTEDIYVGVSRAKFMLFMFVREGFEYPEGLAREA